VLVLIEGNSTLHGGGEGVKKVGTGTGTSVGELGRGGDLFRCSRY